MNSKERDSVVYNSKLDSLAGKSPTINTCSGFPPLRELNKAIKKSQKSDCLNP